MAKCSEKDINALVTEILQHARAEFGQKLDSVILYGSYARHQADEESDVDVMVLVDETYDILSSRRYPWNRFGTELDLKYGVLTSLKLQDTETFYKWKDTLPFYKNVLSEGVRFRA